MNVNVCLSIVFVSSTACMSVEQRLGIKMLSDYHSVDLTFARPRGVKHCVSHAATLAQPGEDNVFISGIVMGFLN